MTHFPPDRDLSKLDTVFRERVEQLVAGMRAAGFDARVWEAWRSFERAEHLQKAGTGVSRSMHCYGLAVDITSEAHNWSPSADFWRALDAGAQSLGLTWGGRWRRADKPHVQALPTSCDDWVRNATAADIAERVSDYLAAVEDASDKPTVPESPSSKPPKPRPPAKEGGRR